MTFSACKTLPPTLGRKTQCLVAHVFASSHRRLWSALRKLAAEGKQWAQDRLVERDPDALRGAAEAALGRGDVPPAWISQYLSMRHGADLTKSTMHPYHDGGQQDGEFYDSYFGGALYVSGDEALTLPSMTSAEHREAKVLAQEIFARSR